MEAAAFLALVCTAGCVACLVYQHLAPTGYSPVRNAPSEYGVGAHARRYGLQAASSAATTWRCSPWLALVSARLL